MTFSFEYIDKVTRWKFVVMTKTTEHYFHIKKPNWFVRFSLRNKPYWRDFKFEAEPCWYRHNKMDRT